MIEKIIGWGLFVGLGLGISVVLIKAYVEIRDAIYEYLERKKLSQNKGKTTNLNNSPLEDLYKMSQNLGNDKEID